MVPMVRPRIAVSYVLRHTHNIILKIIFRQRAQKQKKRTMKILIISPSKGLYDSQSEGYNGAGWVASLQQHLEKEQDVELALVFVTPTPLQKEKRGNTMYYPVHIPDRSGLKKLYYYWQGYKKDVFDKSIVNPLKEVINDFAPDVIHIFGTESNLAYIIDETDIPCVVHLQGLLCAVSNISYPAGMSENDFMSITDRREFWLRNGIVFNNRRMKVAAEREKEHLKRCRYIIGRTQFDKEIAELYNPGVQYFHVEEVLRTPFYNAGKWKYKGGKLKIVSTLSPTIYKGFDVVLKAAKALQETGIDFEWNIIGINGNHKIIKMIEKSCGLCSAKMNINYLGIKRPEEMIEILHNATIYVNPSYIDNSPNSLCEALYLGVPTIATNVGGIPTMMNYDEKYMASPVVPHSLAVRILALYKEIDSGKYINSLAPMAQERHNPVTIINNLKNAYRTIINDIKHVHI